MRLWARVSLLLVILVTNVTIVRQAAVIMSESFPQPFGRKLELSHPPASGRDVVILQNLLRRVKGESHLVVTSLYDQNTAKALRRFQGQQGIKPTGVLDQSTARTVLKTLMSDGYRDSGTMPPGYKYKFFIPVYKDRNKETVGSLINRTNHVVYRFRVRAHGALYSDGSPINQLTTNGNTVTGLMTSDLNSREPWPKKFGIYPVVRCVKGLEGNAAIGKNKGDTFISNYRSGILIHTGQWENWLPSQNMPNSKGCMHVHPEDMEALVKILTTELDATVNENPFGKLPYPYEVQGLVSIEEIDNNTDALPYDN